MARVRRVLIVLGLALCAALGSAAPAAAINGSISGKVVDATTDVGIADVWVCTHSSFMLGPFGGCAFTDGDGKYTIAAIAPSSYLVVFNEEGRRNHLAQWYHGKATREEAEAVTVGDGQAVSNIDAELPVSGKIAGTVTDVVTGLPIAGVEACAPEAGGFRDGAVTHCARSDSEGKYTIEGLATGSYKVEFGVEEEPNYVSQYYNGKDLWPQAEAVSVVAPNVTPGIDAAMKEGVQITGQLTEAGTGSPVKWVSVCALQAGSGVIKDCVSAREDGSYSLAGLPLDSYVVSFAVDWEEEGLVLHPDGYVRQYYDGKPTFAEAQAVAGPVAGLYPGIDAVLAQGPEIGLHPRVYPSEQSIPQVQAPQVELGEGPVNGPLPPCRKGFHRKQAQSGRRCVRNQKNQRGRKHGTRRASR